ncbi:hypothetical protein TNCV_3534621 [Trichonephila clavipes]|nr:hypothetical protein TNCV_3534621 [Trichonephila clavipes]
MGNPGHWGSYIEVSGENRGCCLLCLTTELDFWGAYLHWLGLPTFRPFQDGWQPPTPQCNRLDKYPTDYVVNDTGRLGVK